LMEAMDLVHGSCTRGLLLTVVDGFVLSGRDVAAPAVDPSVVEPVHPLQGGQLKVVPVAPRPVPTDQLRLVQSHDALGQGVSVRIPDGAGRAVHPASESVVV